MINSLEININKEEKEFILERIEKNTRFKNKLDKFNKCFRV